MLDLAKPREYTSGRPESRRGYGLQEGVGVGLGLDVGVGEGLGVGFGVAAGLGVGRGVILTVGFGVGVGLGVGVIDGEGDGDGVSGPSVMMGSGVGDRSRWTFEPTIGPMVSRGGNVGSAGSDPSPTKIPVGIAVPDPNAPAGPSGTSI
jgi:hypothetical protein